MTSMCHLSSDPQGPRSMRHLMTRRMGSLSRALSLTSFGLTLSACLPVHDEAPACFPEEPCKGAARCVAGRCEPAPTRAITLQLSCLRGASCLEELSTRALGSALGEPTQEEPTQEDLLAGASEEASPSAPVEACLIIEQASALSAAPITLPYEETAPLSLSLLAGGARPSLVVLQGGGCLAEDELKARALHQTCLPEMGCVLRLRHPQVEVSDELSLIFEGEEGQCLESSWGANPPTERCDQLDDDCDGFIDEGVSCL